MRQRRIERVADRYSAALFPKTSPWLIIPVSDNFDQKCLRNFTAIARIIYSVTPRTLLMNECPNSLARMILRLAVSGALTVAVDYD